MAKKTSSSVAPGPSSSNKSGPNQMESSIDDIFAKPSKVASSSRPMEISKSAKEKGKAKADASVSSLSTEIAAPPKKKKKKAKQIASFDPDNTAPPAKSRVVETVMDPSLEAISAQVASAKAAASQGTVKRKRDKKEDEQDEIFRDSRGTGPRRQTEEGYNIYKEAELGINPEAGGTPLCPFDCDCCVDNTLPRFAAANQPASIFT